MIMHAVRAWTIADMYIYILYIYLYLIAVATGWLSGVYLQYMPECVVGSRIYNRFVDLPVRRQHLRTDHIVIFMLKIFQLLKDNENYKFLY